MGHRNSIGAWKYDGSPKNFVRQRNASFQKRPTKKATRKHRTTAASVRPPKTPILKILMQHCRKDESNRPIQPKQRSNTSSRAKRLRRHLQLLNSIQSLQITI